MLSVWLLTKKNLKLLLRAKSSALIVLFAPLLIILILGLSYNSTSTFGINIGVYSSSFSDDAVSFMSTLQEDNFKITKYDSSIEECKEDIKTGKVHTCIDLPPSLQVEGNTAKEVTFYVDPSRINLVWMIQDVVKTKFDFKAQQLSQELSQEVISTLDDTKSKISDKKSQIGVIKEKANSVTSTITSAQEILSGVDTTPPATSYNKAVITSLTAQINEGKDELDDAKNALDDINITTSGKEEIEDLLDNANTKLDEALSLVSGNATTNVDKLITSIEADLEATKLKLTAAAVSMESSSSTLSQAITIVNEGVSAANSLDNGLNEINADLEAGQSTGAETIAVPLKTKIERVGEEKTFLNYLFSVLLVIVVMFSSLPLGTTLVMMEKNSPAFFRSFFVPVRKGTFIAATYLTNVILILVQISVILGISLFFLKDILSVLPTIALILFTAASVFTFLGMGIGYLFKSEETGVLASISLGSIIMFMSGTILPLESIASSLQSVTAFSPFVIAEKLIREVLLFSTPLTAIWVDVVLLLGYALVLFLIILIIESVFYNHLINRFTKHHHKKHRQKDKQQLQPKNVFSR